MERGWVGFVAERRVVVVVGEEAADAQTIFFSLFASSSARADTSLVSSCSAAVSRFDSSACTFLL
jgi:hypothetical protein